MKVVLLGGSNSIKKNGLSKYFRDYHTLYNYSLGASSSLQNLYEIIRWEKVLQESDIVICESNVNDFHNTNMLDTDIATIEQNIKSLYERLSSIETKVIVLLLPLLTKKYKFKVEINNIHLKYIKLYKLDYVDIDSFYKKNGVEYFYDFDNLDHPLDYLMYRLGEKIIDNFSQYDIGYNIISDDDRYVILNGFGCDKKSKNNSQFNENITLVSDVLKLDYDGYKIIGIHSWNDSNSIINIFSANCSYSRGGNNENQFHDISTPFMIDSNTYIVTSKCNFQSEKTIRFESNSLSDSNFGLVALFIREKNEKKLIKINRHGKIHNNLLAYMLKERNNIEQYISYKKNSRWLYKFVAKNKNNIVIRYLYSIKRLLL
ncbi:SGNH/GDSL hydrolase family protein [Photobacterium phosphoreum]|uniref:SGNH/GDSL hydrolase family protein n=2 Tax=Photobacterium phosphoreum TaxID=659 RepID=UPI000CF3E5A0|nr:SGNH/GDSL hydrolase family protein [Photobacterium phosphoreum]PQJ91726.1 hypothetical protein BTO21_08450 [Photobacterium phosphoreum]PSV67102.1 SGNH/GDSL hydrolase family protein [Photobacterium phosphoreum]